MKSAAALLLCMALAGGVMAQSGSPNDFLIQNQDTFQILNALVAKADPIIAAVLKNSSAAGTYFLPSDEAFNSVLGNCWLSSNTSLTGPNVTQIVAKVDSLPSANATNFIKPHAIGSTVKNAQSLNGTNANGLMFNVNTDSGYLMATVSNNYTVSGGANVLGGVAIPAGQATIFVIDALLADPSLITGAPCSPGSSSAASSASSSASTAASSSAASSAAGLAPSPAPGKTAPSKARKLAL